MSGDPFPPVSGRPSGVEGPGPMVFTSAGWVAKQNLGDEDLTAVPTPTLVRRFNGGDQAAGLELGRRLAYALGNDNEEA